MAYLVLAVGGLTTAIGLFLLATGFPVIEIERGWATVIAGATLTAGGLVTASLGLILRTLAGLKGTLSGSLSPTPVFAASPGAPMAPAAPSLATAPEVPPLPIEPAIEPSPTIDHGATPTPKTTPILVEAPVTTEIDAPSSVEESRYSETGSILDRLEAHETRVELDRPLPNEAPTAEVHGLDHAFEDIEPAVQAPTEPELPPEPARNEPSGERKPETQASEITEKSAVIGRYEADGTSYVMYADGSIEAQSPSGVYRFASMAELKSFIEG